MALRDEIQPNYSTKTYDVYDLGDQLLMVAHDRLYHAGFELSDLIPNKGKAATQLAVFWFELFEGFLDSSFITADVNKLPETYRPFSDELDGRFMLLAKVEEFAVNAQVVGYLTRPVLDEYMDKGTVGGVEAETGLVLNSLLKQAIYIPYLLDIDGQPSAQVDLMQTVELFGNRNAMLIASTALEFYGVMHGLAKSRGIIFADVTLRFGLAEGQFFITSVPTVDDSLVWSAGGCEPGQEHDLFVFQGLNDWLAENRDAGLPLPALPPDLIDRLSERYVEVTESVTGEDLTTA